MAKTKKTKLINWEYNNKPITSIEDIPKGVIGFIYELTFEDGKKYVGKKNLFSITTCKPLKSGEPRPNAIRFFKNINGKRTPFDKVRKESNWKDYKGSSSKTKSLTPIKRTILAFAISNMNLTYLETKYLFSLGCLETEEYLNDNILGKFYRVD